MNNFEYTRVADVSGAVNAVAHQLQAKFIAGGTNLIDLMKENVMRPERLVDITRLPLTSIASNAEGGLRLGALVTNAETAYNAQIEERYPLLAKAILSGASPQLRNMATNGGNLLQRTRCLYFYDAAMPCNKREPGTGCPAIAGENRTLAILGTSEQCIATHPSDMCIALAALDAVVNVTGQTGDRRIPFAEFHRLPGDTPYIDTNLAQDEIITSIDLPAEGYTHHYEYLKVRDRQSYAFALVSVAVGLVMDGETIQSARIALGGVAHKPWRDLEAEAMLDGKIASEPNFERVAAKIVQEAKGFSQNTFKITLAQRAVIRALSTAAGLAPQPKQA